jgi:hypothetical protein
LIDGLCRTTHKARHTTTEKNMSEGNLQEVMMRIKGSDVRYAA